MSRRQLLPLLLTALLLAVCAALPALFLPAEEAPPVTTPGPFNAAYRAAMYARAAAGDLEKTPLEEPEAAEALSCRRLMDTVLLGLVPDEGGSETLHAAGTNYYAVADETGREIRVMEFYREWTADWRNWFIIQADLSGGPVYHLYWSASCQRNFDRYLGSVSPDAPETAIAESWGAWLGLELGTVSVVDDEHYELVYTDADGAALHYYLWLHIYEDAGPSLVVDLELTLMDAG